MTAPLINLPATALPNGLSDDERNVAWRLATVLFQRRGAYTLDWQYYEGTQPVPTLGISVPPELESLRAIMGWGGDAVNAVSERLALQGFILNGKSEVDDELLQRFQANNIDAESPMVHDDSMIYGNGLVVIGVNDDGEPLITGESPLNMAVHVNRATGIVTCGWQTYQDTDPTSEHYGRIRAGLYMPERTTYMVQGVDSGWEVVERDEHPKTAKYGCSVVAFPNSPSTGNRWGRSEIAPAWRNCMNRASRTMVEVEVMREYHIQQKIMFLGATEKAFQDGNGDYKTIWQSYADFMPAIEPDEEGNVPDVKVIAGQSPDGLLKIVDSEARLMSGYTGLNPQNMGIINTGNPVSGDSIRASDFRLKARTDRKAAANGNGWVRVGRWTYLVMGEDRAELSRAEANWGPTGIPTPGADADAASKRAGAKLIPPRSETELRRQGYSAIETRNIDQEWEEADGRELIDATTGMLNRNAQDTRLQDVTATAESNRARLDAIAPTT